MKVLNLYCGTGGNRRLWEDCQVTAIEIDKKRAELYSSEFPKDEIIISDAHEYLLDHYKEFDFIWSSPPCPTHSRTNYFTQHIRKRPVYPSMTLYEEIIFLDNFFKGKYCIENVIPYYKPLIEPQIIGRHCFWANFKIPKIKQPKDDIGTMIKGHPNRANLKSAEERNEVNSELGLHILEIARRIDKSNKVMQLSII